MSLENVTTIEISVMEAQAAIAVAAAERLVSPARRLYVFGGADGTFPYYATFSAAITAANALTPAPSTTNPVSVVLLSNTNGTPVTISGGSDWYALCVAGIYVSSPYREIFSTTTLPTTLPKGMRVMYVDANGVESLYIGNDSGVAVIAVNEFDIRDQLESLEGYDRLPSRSVKDVESALGVRKYVVGVGQETANEVAVESTTGPAFTHTGDILLPNTLAYSPRLGLYAMTRSSSTGSCILTSPDGKTWTPQTTPTETKSGTCVIWVDELGLFVASAGFSGSIDIIVSSDGITWTQTLNNASMTISGIGWSPKLGLLIVGGGATNPVGNTNISTDGYNWSQVGTAPVSGAPVWVDGVDAFLRTGVSSAYRSIDGTNWTLISKPSGTLKRVLWVDKLNKLFALIGNSIVAVSTDGGNTFSTVLTTSGTTSTQVLVWSDELEKLIVSGGSSTTRLYVSSDGVTWTQPTTPNHAYQQMVWARELGMFVASLGTDFSNNTRVSTSMDAVTWTDQAITHQYSYWLPDAGRILRTTSGTWFVGKSILESIVEPIAQTVKPYLSTLFRITATWVGGILDEYQITTTTDDHDIAGASVSSPGEGNLLIEFNDLPADAFVRGSTLPLDLGGDEGGLTHKIAMAIVGSNLTIYLSDTNGDPLSSMPASWFEIISANA